MDTIVFPANIMVLKLLVLYGLCAYIDTLLLALDDKTMYPSFICRDSEGSVSEICLFVVTLQYLLMNAP
jgi:hypothetical protein